MKEIVYYKLEYIDYSKEVHVRNTVYTDNLKKSTGLLYGNGGIQFSECTKEEYEAGKKKGCIENAERRAEAEKVL